LPTLSLSLSLSSSSHTPHSRLVVAALAIKGNETLHKDWDATFQTYLTEQLSPLGYKFKLQALDFSSTYTAVEEQSIDFVYTNPSVFACLEAEFGAAAVTSQNNLRQGTELYEFGGTFIARSDRDDINVLQDLKDRVVEAVSISGLGAAQVQWREMMEQGMQFLSDPKQIRFAFNQRKIVNDVISGSLVLLSPF
jgi:hypothetical protein